MIGFIVRRALCSCVLLAGGSAVYGQAAGAQATIQLPFELERVLRDYESAWTARDAAGLAALFDEDGWVLSPGDPPVRGRAAIAERYRTAGGPLHLRAVAYAAEERTAWIIGLYGPREGVDGGKFVLALRRADGSRPWLIAADMDNPNVRQEQP